MLQKFFNISLAIGLLGISWITPASVNAASLEEIQQRGELIVGVKDNLRPLGFRDANGNLEGLEIDIAKRLAEELLGNPDKVVLQAVTNRDRINLVLEGKVDLTIARVTITDSRARLVDFSIPYYLDGTGLIAKDKSITQLRDLATKTIAILNGSSTIAIVRYALPEAKLVGVDSYKEARSLIESGNANAFAADTTLLTGWVQEYPDYRILPAQLSAEALCVIMPKGLQYNQLRRRINSAIARWQTEGWLTQRAAAWGLP